MDPYRQVDISVLEKGQRRATKIPIRLKDFRHEERLKVWGYYIIGGTEDNRISNSDLIKL